MNPITNSVIKEQMRQRNESMAQSREAQIRSQLIEQRVWRHERNYESGHCCNGKMSALQAAVWHSNGEKARRSMVLHMGIQAK